MACFKHTYRSYLEIEFRKKLDPFIRCLFVASITKGCFTKLPHCNLENKIFTVEHQKKKKTNSISYSTTTIKCKAG